MKALSNIFKLIQKTKIVSFCIVALFFISLADSHARDWYVSHNGSGLKNGTSAENAWAGWNNIDWDTDGNGPDTGVGPGDTLHVIGTIRAIGFNIKGYGLSEKKRLTIKSYPKNPGKLWQGLEITGEGWKGPDAFGAYYKTVHFPTDYSKAVEWTKDPWTDAVPLETMQTAPDNNWASKSGLYYCDSIFQKVYYKPTSGKTDGKTLTAWSRKPRAMIINEKKYITIFGLIFNSQILIFNGAHFFNIINCEISCKGEENGIQIGDYPGHKPANYGLIQRNYIHDCGNGIYFINQGYGNEHNNDHWTVEYNYIANIHGTKDSHGIGVQGGTGNIFQFNHIFNTGTGITFWNAQQQIMQNNIVRFNKVHHMGYYGKGNGNGRGIEFSGETADSNLTTGNMIYGNIVSDCSSGDGHDGVCIRSKMGFPNLKRAIYPLKIFNNTVSSCAISFYVKPTNYEQGRVGAYLHNNISLSPKINGYHVYVQPIGKIYQLSLNSNIYSNHGKFFYKKDSETSALATRRAEYGKLFTEQDTQYSLRNWQNATNTDANSIFTSGVGRLDELLIPQESTRWVCEGEDLSSIIAEKEVFGLLDPKSVFPTGVNSGKIILTNPCSSYDRLTRKCKNWYIGAYVPELKPVNNVK